MYILVQESESKALKVNVSKTQVIVVFKEDAQVSANIVIKNVRNFKYLGSSKSEDSRSDRDINA